MEDFWIGNLDETILIDELLAFVDQEVSAVLLHLSSPQDCSHPEVIGLLDHQLVVVLYLTSESAVCDEFCVTITHVFVIELEPAAGLTIS